MHMKFERSSRRHWHSKIWIITHPWRILIKVKDIIERHCLFFHQSQSGRDTTSGHCTRFAHINPQYSFSFFSERVHSKIPTLLLSKSNITKSIWYVFEKIITNCKLQTATATMNEDEGRRNKVTASSVGKVLFCRVFGVTNKTQWIELIEEFHKLLRLSLKR